MNCVASLIHKKMKISTLTRFALKYVSCLTHKTINCFVIYLSGLSINPSYKYTNITGHKVRALRRRQLLTSQLTDNCKPLCSDHRRLLGLQQSAGLAETEQEYSVPIMAVPHSLLRG